jgi:hypothetical protein
MASTYGKEKLVHLRSVFVLDLRNRLPIAAINLKKIGAEKKVNMYATFHDTSVI